MVTGEKPTDTWIVPSYYRELAITIVTFVFAGFATYSAGEALQLHGIIGLIVKALTCCVLPNVVFVVVNMRNRYFLYSKEFLLKVKDNQKKSLT